MFTLDEVRQALADCLLAERPGAATGFSGVTNDSRLARDGQLFVALKTEARDGHDYIADAIARGVTAVVCSRTGVPAPAGVWLFQVSDTKHAIGDLARAYRSRFPVRAVAVAGNVGKTTTKEIIAAVLSSRFGVLKSPANFNDEVGLAMTLFGLTPEHERAVLEVGMFELGEIERLCQVAQPDTAVVLNVGPTHLERLGSMEAIARAKSEAVRSLPASGTAILNADDDYVAAMAEQTPARVLTFGIARPATLRAVDVRSRGLQGVDFTVEMGGRALPAHSPLPGAPLVANALAALAAAMVEGMSLQEAVGALACAQVPARLQVSSTSSGATILDDSYNANPASMLAALGVLAETPGRRLALLGDMLELGQAEAEGHESVGRAAAGSLDELFTLGERGRLIAEAARRAGSERVQHFESKEEAVAVLRERLQPGDVLLIKASHGLDLGAVAKELLR